MARSLLPRVTVPVLLSLLAAGCTFFERTTSWEEEVALSDGSTLLVSRSITRGPDEWFRPGRGGTQRSTFAAPVPKLGKVELKPKTN